MPSTLIRRHIRTAVQGGRSLAQIEHELLDGTPLPSDSRDALWLYAWSLTWKRDARAKLAA